MRVSDAELCAALGRPRGSSRARPWPRASSAPIELVSRDGLGPCCSRISDGASARSSRRASSSTRCASARPTSVLPRRARRAALPTRPADGVAAPRARRRRPAVGRRAISAAWEAAARWLARLHAARRPPAARRCCATTRAHLRRWLAARSGARARARCRDRAALRARRSARLAALPAVLVHGEAYPSNVLVDRPDGPRIRPVDWETLGTGPAALDLAALTSGRLGALPRATRVVAAYARGCRRRRAPTTSSTRHVSSWRCSGSAGRASWTPPPEQRHDWLGEAIRAGEALAR